MKTLSQQIQAYLGKMSEADRRALLLLCAFAGAIVLYLIWNSAETYRQQSLQNFDSNRELHHWMQSIKPRLNNTQTIPSGPAPTDGLSLLNNSARKFGLSLQRVQPEQGKGISVWLENASYDNTLRWIEHLQRGGAQLHQVNINKTGPGLINLRAQLSFP